MRILKTVLIAVPLVLLAVGCADRSTPIARPVLSKTIRATLTITVPRPKHLHSGLRTQYVSAGTQSALLTIGDLPPEGLDLSSTSPYCVPAPNGIACTFPVTAPLGYDTFTLAAYDQPLNGEGQPQGVLLSTGSTQADIIEGQANEVQITLDGVIASMQMSLSNPLVYWDRSLATLTVDAFDATGYKIVGNYVSSVGLSVTPPKAPLEPYNFYGIDGSTETATIVDGFGERIIDGTPRIIAATTYTGQTVTSKLKVLPIVQSGTVAMSVPGTTEGGIWISTPIDRALQPGEIIPLSFGKGTRDPTGITFGPTTSLYVADAGLNAILTYLAGTGIRDGTAGVIEGAATGISEPTGIAANATSIFLLMPSSIAIFPIGQHGDIAPTAVISGSNTGLSGANCIAVDASNIYVLNGPSNEVEIFPLDASGNLAPTATISGSNTGLNAARGIGLDSSDDLYVANTGNADVEVFAPGASGNIAPLHTIAGAATELAQPYAVGVDGPGNIYVADSVTNLILIFSPGSSGDVTPSFGAQIADNAIEVGNAITVWP
jgi:hypothetical protein